MSNLSVMLVINGGHIGIVTHSIIECVIFVNDKYDIYRLDTDKLHS